MESPSFLKRRVSEKRFNNLRKGLRKARLAIPPKEWIDSAILYSITIGLIALPICFALFSFIIRFPTIISVLLSALVSLGSGYLTYRIFLYYPSLTARNRKKEIDDMLPHAVAFMLALGKGGFEPVEIFKSLSERRDEYGEISKEAGAIYRNVEFSKNSSKEAIKEIAETTPSDKLRDFLNSFLSVIETSADITKFLSKKCDEFYSRTEEEQKKNLETLGVLSEVYVVALGLGPLLGIVLLVLMGMMGQFYVLPLRLIVYIGIPLGTLLFALILDMQIRSTVKSGSSNKERSGNLNKKSEAQWKNKLKEILKSPFQKFKEAPVQTLWITVPVAGIFTILSILSGWSITTTLILDSLIVLIPYSISFELKRRRMEKMTGATPDFLNAFSNAVSSGLTPVRALKTLPPSRFGALSIELSKVKRDIEWGSPVSEALGRMGKRIESGLLRWVIHLMERSMQSVSDLAEILDILAKDVTMERLLKEERKRVTITYLMIIYVTFGVFLLTAYSVSESFIPLLPEASTSVGGGLTVGGIGTGTIHTIFFHASLIQAFCAGLLAGKLETGEILSGLKHSAIMVIAAWLVFTLLVF